MSILIDPNGNYPRHYGDVIAENEGWVFGDALPEGWHVVNETPMPEVDGYEVIYTGEPELRKGEYYQVWLKRPMTQEEIDILEAPAKARQKLIELGFTELEIAAISKGL
jgi:hypothetical protein